VSSAAAGGVLGVQVLAGVGRVGGGVGGGGVVVGGGALVFGGGEGHEHLAQHRGVDGGEGELADGGAVAVVPEQEPDRGAGALFLGGEDLLLVGVGAVGGDDGEQGLAGGAEPAGAEVAGVVEHHRFGAAPGGGVEVGGEGVEGPDDDVGGFLGDVAGGERGADPGAVLGVFVGVQGVGELEAAGGGAVLGEGLVGPPVGGGGGADVGADVEGVGVCGDAELELGEGGGEPGDLLQGVGGLGGVQGPHRGFGELGEPFAELGDGRGDRVGAVRGGGRHVTILTPIRTCERKDLVPVEAVGEAVGGGRAGRRTRRADSAPAGVQGAPTRPPGQTPGGKRRGSSWPSRAASGAAPWWPGCAAG
jgi:hypothetical protein